MTLWLVAPQPPAPTPAHRSTRPVMRTDFLPCNASLCVLNSFVNSRPNAAGIDRLSHQPVVAMWLPDAPRHTAVHRQSYRYLPAPTYTAVQGSSRSPFWRVT